jgi:hypothetical protein
MSNNTSARPINFPLLAGLLIFAGVVAFGPGLRLSSSARGTPVETAQVAVGPQYGSTHVYVSPKDFDRFVASIIATFGGNTSPKGLLNVTPTPSQTMSQIIFTPVGTFSVLGFKTPIPYPFGSERSGYLVSDIDVAVNAARAHGAEVRVATFPDAIGRDAVIQWPGGVNMQLYWHTSVPSYATLQTIPENRVYVSPDTADAFVQAFTGFAHGRILADNGQAPGVEIGRPNDTYRQIRIASLFGNMTVFVTDGHLPYPFGRELTGYEVANLAGALSKAKAAMAAILVEPFRSSGRESAVVQFPGGFIAEIHSPLAR